MRFIYFGYIRKPELLYGKVASQLDKPANIPGEQALIGPSKEVLSTNHLRQLAVFIDGLLRVCSSRSNATMWVAGTLSQKRSFRFPIRFQKLDVLFDALSHDRYPHQISARQFSQEIIHLFHVGQRLPLDRRYKVAQLQPSGIE